MRGLCCCQMRQQVIASTPMSRVPDRVLGLSVQKRLLFQRQLHGTRCLPSGKTLLCCRGLVGDAFVCTRKWPVHIPSGKSGLDDQRTSLHQASPRLISVGSDGEKMQLREPAPKTMKIQSRNQHVFRVDASKKGQTICHSQPALLQSHCISPPVREHLAMRGHYDGHGCSAALPDRPVSLNLAEDPTDYDLLQPNTLLPTFTRLMAR